MPSTPFSYTGGWQTFTVPAGISSITVELWGAGSGGVAGGYVKGNFAVTAGQVIYILCGGAGKNGATGSTHAQAGGGAPVGSGGAGGQGYNAQGGDSGGGYSICRVGSTSGTVKACAGGAGGSGGDGVAGGKGGNSVGASGGGGDYGGKGGNTTSGTGGAAGAADGGRSRLDGDPGSFLHGGAAGGESSLNGAGGGGGGGGYYGGGGGTGASTGFQSTGGGGGGSSYWTPLSSPVATQGGGNTGNGSAKITYAVPDIAPAIPTSVAPTSGTLTKSTGSLAVTCHVSDPDGGTVRALYRTSTNPAFPAGSYSDHYSSYVASGSAAPLTITGFTQNTHWYMRVYAQDPSGIYSSGYATTDFWTNRAPNTPVLVSPANGDGGPAASDATFSWTFSDPDPADTQGSALLNFRKHGSSDAWQTIAVSGSANSATIPGGTLADSTDYDWFVSYKDAGGLSSAQASPVRVWHASGPTAQPTLTGPVDGDTVNPGDTVAFTWAFQDPDVGDTQSKADLGTRPKGGDGTWTVHAAVATTASTYSATPTALGLGTQAYEWAVRTYDHLNNVSGWSSPRTLNVLPTLGVPTITNPVQSEVVGTSTPSLGATVADGIPAYQPRKLEWLVASNAGFTTDVKDYIQPDSRLQTSPTFSDTLPVSDEIDQTHTWWIKVRQLDGFGQSSAYSAAISFTSSHPPTVLNFTPTGGHYEARSAASKFSWVYTSSSSDSVQSAFQVQVQLADGSPFYDSTKTTSPNNFVTVDLSAIAVDTPMRWRVRVYDEDDVVSGWSPWQAFIIGDAPVFTISPVNGTTVESGEPTVSWDDLVIGGTRIQKQWQVDFNLLSDGSLIYTATGTDSTVRSFTPPQTILLNDQDYSVTVTITDSGDLSSSVTSFFHTTFVVPDVLPYAVDISQIDVSGAVIIDWSEAIPDDSITSWRVYRRRDTETNWTLLSEISNVNTMQYHDYLFNSGTNYLYTVTQIADRDGSLVESPLGFSAFYIAERDNLALNPNAQIDESGWTPVVETGGGSIAAPVRETDGGPFNGTYVRQTWSVGSTTESSGIGQTTDTGSIAFNDTVTGSMYVRPSATQMMVLKIRWLDAGGTVLGTTTGVKILCTPDAWTRIFATGIAPSGTDHALVYAAVTSDASSNNWLDGDWLDAGAMLIGKTDQLWDYFDGSSPGGHWNGDVGLSTSYQTQIWNAENTVYFVQSDQYWIIDPLDELATVMLPNATSAPLQEVYETNVYEIIGRGRKVDYGTRLGFTGEIDCALRGYDGTPALVRAKVEYARARKDTIWIRTPFGDLFPASLGDTTFTPIAGVGNVAMYDAAIPYNEVCT